LLCPQAKDHAGVGYHQEKKKAEGDTHYAMLRERIDLLWSRLDSRRWIELIAQTVC